MICFSGANFQFLFDFDMMSYVILVASAGVTIISSVTKFMAYKYHEASDLQKLAFLPTVW